MSDPAGNDSVHINVASHLRRAAQIQPFKRAVVCPAGRDRCGRVVYAQITFQQLDRESDRMAHGLQCAGIGRGASRIAGAGRSRGIARCTSDRGCGAGC